MYTGLPAYVRLSRVLLTADRGATGAARETDGELCITCLGGLRASSHSHKASCSRSGSSHAAPSGSGEAWRTSLLLIVFFLPHSPRGISPGFDVESGFFIISDFRQRGWMLPHVGPAHEQGSSRQGGLFEMERMSGGLVIRLRHAARDHRYGRRSIPFKLNFHGLVQVSPQQRPRNH